MNAKTLSLISVLTGSLFFTGCSSIASFFTPREEVKPVIIQTVAKPKTRLAIPSQEPVSTRKVQWFIITPENVEEVFSKLKSDNVSVVLFGLTDDGYENLALNLRELRAFIVREKAVIGAYKDYYEPEK